MASHKTGQELRVLTGTQDQVGNLVLMPDEMFHAIDTGARYIGAGPGGRPKGLVNFETSPGGGVAFTLGGRDVNLLAQVAQMRPIRMANDLAGWTLSNSGTAATATLDTASPFGVPCIRLDLPNGNSYAQLTASGLKIPGFSGSAGRVVWVLYIEDATIISQVNSIIGDAGFAQSNNLGTTVASSDRNNYNGVHVIEHASSALAYGITDLRIRPFGGSVPAGKVGRVWVLGAFAPEPKKPFVSITFDDADVSMYTKVALELNRRGWRGTFGINKIQVDAGAQFVTTANLHEMYAAGHDLSSHNIDNFALGTNQTLEQYLADYDACAAWMRSNGWTRGLVYHPWVQGKHSPNGVQAMYERGVIVTRSATARRNVSQIAWNFNGPIVVPEQVLDNSNTLAAVKTMIDNAITYGQDVCIEGHVIAAAPGVITWAEADWIALLDYLQEKQFAGQLGGVGSITEHLAHRRTLI